MWYPHRKRVSIFTFTHDFQLPLSFRVDPSKVSTCVILISNRDISTTKTCNVPIMIMSVVQVGHREQLFVKNKAINCYHSLFYYYTKYYLPSYYQYYNMTLTYLKIKSCKIVVFSLYYTIQSFQDLKHDITIHFHMIFVKLTTLKWSSHIYRNISIIQEYGICNYLQKCQTCYKILDQKVTISTYVKNQIKSYN